MISDSQRAIRIGGACGFWGESTHATAQLLAAGEVDFIVYDYLAEITMSILARARRKDSQHGYATDFVTAAMAPNLHALAEQQVRIVSNAGGVNPQACAAALRHKIAEAGVDLTVAVVSGDDLIDRIDELSSSNITEMFSEAPFPPTQAIASVNAYLGAFPIAAALDGGADIVITGRAVDSALTLAACIHAFGWQADQYDLLAAGSLAGHIIECTTQATGGNLTDWNLIDRFDEIGYPVASVEAHGRITVSKAADTGGLVSTATVSEQILYEIEDPQAYALPDVRCDFSAITVEAIAANQVRVEGARGDAPSDRYKVSLTWADGFRGGQLLFFYGEEAAAKARAFASAVFDRAARRLRDHGLDRFTETLVEIHGDESHYGAQRRDFEAREVTLKIAARHPEPRAIELLLRDAVGMALSAPPGLTLFSAAGRPRPSPVVRLFSFLIPKSDVAMQIHDQDGSKPFSGINNPKPAPSIRRPGPPDTAAEGPLTSVRLIDLAGARSGDKGDRANIGVIARHPNYLTWIWRSLTTDAVAARFDHFLRGRVERFLLPGLDAINFVLHDVLGGGGVASLRNDPQGKGYAQLLLDAPIEIPTRLLEEHAQ